MKELFKVIDALLDSPGKKSIRHLYHKENEILHSVLNSLSEGVIIADQNGNFMYFNDSAQKILGVGSREIEIREWTSVYGCFYEDTVTPFPAEELPLAKAIQDMEVLNQIIYINNAERPGGVYINVSARPLKDSQGIIRGGTVIFSDITERKRAEISHKQSESRVHAQFKGIPIPTYVWQKTEDDFILIDYNYASDEISRNQMHRFKGNKLSAMYAHVPDILEQFHSSMTAETAQSKEMTYQMLTTGEIKDVIVHFVKIPPDMVMMHMMDVTDLKENQRELQKLYSAIEQTADSVFITDRKGIIEYVNPAFEITTEYSSEELLGHTPSLLKSGRHDKEFYDELWKTISGGHAYKGTIINRKKGGTLYWSEQTITPMKDEDGRIRHYVSVLRDITQLRKQQEQEFQMQLAKEVQKNLYKNAVKIPDFDIAVSSLPAAETNGDYYDIVQMSESVYGVIIGDVMGHSISSALIMAQTRAYLHAFMKHETDPGILLTWLNKELVKDLDETRFVTLVLVRIDLEKRCMVYASAGHISGFLLNASGETKQVLDSTGIPLGFIPNYRYETSSPIGLYPGDFFVLLTDGIVESHDKDENEFGLEKTIQIIRENGRESIHKIQKNLHKAVLDFASDQDQEDDITSVICKYIPDHSMAGILPDCVPAASMQES